MSSTWTHQMWQKLQKHTTCSPTVLISITCKYQNRYMKEDSMSFNIMKSKRGLLSTAICSNPPPFDLITAIIQEIFQPQKHLHLNEIIFSIMTSRNTHWDCSGEIMPLTLLWWFAGQRGPCEVDNVQADQRGLQKTCVRVSYKYIQQKYLYAVNILY